MLQLTTGEATALSVFALLLIICPIIFGWITHSMGKARGRNNCFWWGFFLGFIGIIIVGVGPNKK